MTSSGEFVKVKQAFRIAYPYVECDIDTQYSQLKTLLESELLSTSAGLATYISSFIDPTEIASTVAGLASITFISSSGLASTITGLGTFGYVSSLSLQSTVAGLGTSGYVSSLSLTSSLEGLGTFGYVSSLSLQSTTEGLITIISTFVDPFELASTVTGLATASFISSSGLNSSIVGLGTYGYVSSLSLTSSLEGLGTFGYISSLSLQSTVAGLGSSRYLSSYSTTVFQSNLGSTITGLGSSDYVSSLSLQSTTAGLITVISTFVDPFELASTVTGLATASFISSSGLNSSIVGLGTYGYVSSLSLASTVEGLGSSGYVSSLSLQSNLGSTITGLGSSGFISSLSLTSTIEGLGTYGYISSLSLQSTVAGLGSSDYVSSLSLQSTTAGLITVISTFVDPFELASTVTGLATASFISSSGLNSSIIGLGTYGYVSSLSLQSTVEGLGTYGYLSSYSTTVFQSNLGSTLTGLGTYGYLSSYSTTVFQSNLGSTIAGLGTYGFISSLSLQSTVEGLGSSGYLSSYSTTVFQSNLGSTIVGLGSLGYISTALSFQSTVEGLGTSGYVSSLSLQSTTLVLQQAISTVAASPGVSTLSTVVSQGLSTLSTTIGFQISSILSSYTTFARLGNTLTVDQINGNDTTAAPSGLPYKTVNAAINNLVQGDTVWILPGTYVLTNSITLLPNTSLRGMSLQTCKLIMSNVTSNTTMLTMGENSRVEDLSWYLHSQEHHTLIGVNFPGTTNLTAKIRPSVITVDNSSAPFSGDSSDVYTIYINGTGNLGQQSFSFNCLKGSTFNLFSNGRGRKRGILVDGNGCIASSRDVNIYVRNPTDITSLGSYVGVETSNTNAVIQLRTTAVSGAIKGGSYTSSDILQTLGRIEIGPGTDLITRSAGTSSFTTFVYPTTIFYALKGNLNTAELFTAWLWPGTGNAIKATGTQPSYPDATISYYRIQQSAILYGVTSYLTGAPGSSGTPASLSNSTIVTFQRNGIDIPFKMGYGGIENGVKHESTLSCDLTIGDLLSVKLSLSTNGNPIATNLAHDLSIQVDIF